jgi:hypothetical protein
MEGGVPIKFDTAAEHGTRGSVQDLKDAVRQLDAMDQCNSIVPFYSLTDVHPKLMSIASFRHTLSCTTKPLKSAG